jgi:hypothetical protein
VLCTNSDTSPVGAILSGGTSEGPDAHGTDDKKLVSTETRCRRQTKDTIYNAIYSFMRNQDTYLIFKNFVGENFNVRGFF